MIQFLVHEKKDTVGVATVDIKAGETAKGIFSRASRISRSCKLWQQSSG